MRNKNFQYDFIKGDEISIIFIINKEGRVFEVLIDTKNLDRVINFKYLWHADWHDNDEYYITTSTYEGHDDKGKSIHETIYLQRFILDGKISPKDLVDHINFNKLDNRESNLRITNSSNNLKNRTHLNKNNKSGYRNVSWILGWYRIQLQINGTNHMFPEKFKDVEEAASFAEEMRKEYYGEYAGMG